MCSDAKAEFASTLCEAKTHVVPYCLHACRSYTKWCIDSSYLRVEEWATTLCACPRDRAETEPLTIVTRPAYLFADGGLWFEQYREQMEAPGLFPHVTWEWKEPLA